MIFGLFKRSLVGERAPHVSGDVWFNQEGLPEQARQRAEAGEPLRLPKDFDESVVLVDFWDYSCVNCVRTLPYLREWWQRYQEYGLVIIGVHTPEFEFGKNADNVENAVLQFRLNYPVVNDPEYVTWHRYHNNVWPRELLVDHKGKVQHDHRGEGGYQETEAKIQELLSALHPEASFNDPLPPVRETDAPGAVCFPVTPEVYLGFGRGQPVNGELDSGEPKEFVLPEEIPLHSWALGGSWRAQEEEIVHGRAGHAPEDILALHYKATTLLTVMRTLDKSEAVVEIRQDGQPLTEENKGSDVKLIEGKSVVRVVGDRLFELVENPQHGEYVLQLSTDSDQVAIHTFTFGSSCQ